jgi:DNA-binding NarL/FixJ family response regulator
MGLAQLLGAQPDLECCGEADSEAAVRSAVRSLRPDLLIMDLWLRGADGLELVKSLRAECPDSLILICTQLEETLFAERALRAGAMGYIGKDRPVEELLGAIRTVLNGELALSRKMATLLLRRSVDGRQAWGSSGLEVLTDRELQVFMLIGAGVSSREAAHKLGISLKTIESYRENIKRKLGLRDAAELTHHAALFISGSASPARQ